LWAIQNYRVDTVLRMAILGVSGRKPSPLENRKTRMSRQDSILTSGEAVLDELEIFTDFSLEWSRVALVTLSMLQYAELSEKLNRVDVHTVLDSLVSLTRVKASTNQEKLLVLILESFDSATVFTRDEMNQWQDKLMDIYPEVTLITPGAITYTATKTSAFSPRAQLSKLFKRNRQPKWECSPLMSAVLRHMRIPEHTTVTIKENARVYELIFAVFSLRGIQRMWAEHYKHSSKSCFVTDPDHVSHQKGRTFLNENSTHQEQLIAYSNDVHMVQVELSKLVRSGNLHPVEALVISDHSGHSGFTDAFAASREYPRDRQSQVLRVLTHTMLKNTGLCGFPVEELLELVPTGGIDDLSVELVYSMLFTGCTCKKNGDGSAVGAAHMMAVMTFRFFTAMSTITLWGVRPVSFSYLRGN